MSCSWNGKHLWKIYGSETEDILCTDNGGEYISMKFQQYLKREGIRHQLTVPKTLEQNRVAERMNRTLIEKMRATLADAKLPQKFWAEALSTAICATEALQKLLEGMTPFESCMGEKTSS